MTTRQPADSDFFTEAAFIDPVSKEPYLLSIGLKKAVTRICRAYGISGICDPMYIANVIAFELGIGDGQSNFNSGVDAMTPAIGNLQRLLADMEDTTWNHGGDREAANVGYRVTSEKTFQAAKTELAAIATVERRDS